MGAFFMDKRIKYSLKEKLSTVKSITAGKESCLTAARKIGSKENTVQRWLRLYKQHGARGLTLRNGSYDGHFKIRVVRHMLKNKLSLIQTAVLFAIPQDSAVGRWLKIYQCYGQTGLLKKTRGRKKSLMAKKTKKKKGTIADPSAEKVTALQKELEYLRAENAFLKKLEALIQQEEAAKAQSKRPKPSRN